jgi:FkbM family methyltransferase
MTAESLLDPHSVPRISYAPNQEDILLDRLFGDHVGTYMGVGSPGPVHDSLTYFFYRRGWRGVNLEPSRRVLAQFQSLRPGDLNLPLAAWDSNGEVPLFEADAASASPSVRPTFSAQVAEAYRARGVAIDECRVPVRTIGSLVDELAIDPPDFLAIDAEGAEDPAIRGIPLATWRPGVIVVRSAMPATVPDAAPSWEPVLLSHGYHFATFNGINRFYLRDDLHSARPRLELPVNVHDRFLRSEVVALEERIGHLEQQSRRWRVDLVHQQAELEGRLAQAEHEQERWRREYESLRRELIATQRSLRPYRLLDRLGIVSIGYRWARRLKPNRAS